VRAAVGTRAGVGIPPPRRPTIGSESA